MFNTALVALDLSPAESPMLACLGEIGALGVKRLILLHVVEVGYVKGVEYGHEDEIAERLERHAEGLRGAGFEVVTEVRDSGVVAEAVLQAAGEHGADLIVIGSRGQTMLGGLFLGSVAREVLRRSPLPVRLEWIEASGEEGAETCARARPGGLRRLMLATDFSPHAQGAEAVAVGLAPRAELVDLVHVMTPQESARYTRWPVMVRAALDSIAEEVTAAGGRAETHVLTGADPAEDIARHARAREADLIVVGKHGQGWLESVLIGSTAAALCEIARRPVLTVPLRAEGA